MIANAALYLTGVIVALVIWSCLANRTRAEQEQSINEEFEHWKNHDR